MLSLTLIDSLKLNLDKALQPILHFFARMSAQPQVMVVHLQAEFQLLLKQHPLVEEFLASDRYSHSIIQATM